LIGFSPAESRTSHASQVLQEVRRQARHFLDSMSERDRKLRVQLVQDMPVRAWLGSVAEKIVANAECDVLIARSVQETFENR
jgi:hypothetical protein